MLLIVPHKGPIGVLRMGFGPSSVIILLAFFLSVLYQQSLYDGVSAYSIATTDSDNFEELGLSRKSLSIEGEQDSSASKASSTNKTNSVKHSEADRETNDDDDDDDDKEDSDDSEDSSSSTDKSTTSSTSTTKPPIKKLKKLGISSVEQKDSNRDDRSTSTTTKAPSEDDDDKSESNEDKDLKQKGSRSGDFEVAENVDPNESSIILTIHGNKRSKVSTTKRPTFILASNGTSFLSANGTTKPITSENAKEVMEKSDNAREMKKLAKLLQSKTSHFKKSKMSSVVESIKQESSSSVDIVSSDIDKTTGDLSILSSKTTTTLKPLSDTTTKKMASSTTSKKPMADSTSRKPASNSTTKKSISNLLTNQPSIDPLASKPIRTNDSKRNLTNTSIKPTVSSTSKPTVTSTPKPTITSTSKPTITSTSTPKPTITTTKTAKTTPKSSAKPSASTTKKPTSSTSTPSVPSDQSNAKSSTTTTDKPSDSTKGPSGSSIRSTKKSDTKTPRVKSTISPTKSSSVSKTTNPISKRTTPMPDGEPSGTTKLPSSLTMKQTLKQAPTPKACIDCMKDSDKILAIVITKQGAFKGRRLNIKAIETIMKGKLSPSQEDQLQKKKTIEVSVNNTFVLPAGNYYFPHPVRFAGFVSP